MPDIPLMDDFLNITLRPDGSVVMESECFSLCPFCVKPSRALVAGFEGTVFGGKCERCGYFTGTSDVKPRKVYISHLKE